MLAGILLALGERPVVVLRSVHEQHLTTLGALAGDHGPRSDDIRTARRLGGCHGAHPHTLGAGSGRLLSGPCAGSSSSVLRSCSWPACWWRAWSSGRGSIAVHVEQALHAVPAGAKRIGFTDWGVVRREVNAELGDDPSSGRIDDFVTKAYDRDFTAASSVDSAAVAMHKLFGFGPVNAQWEAFAQGTQGAAMVVKVADGTDFDVLADNLRTDGYTKPKDDDGVWEGGADLVASLDGTLSPEVQYVALLEDQGSGGHQRHRRLRSDRGEGRLRGG